MGGDEGMARGGSPPAEARAAPAAESARVFPRAPPRAGPGDEEAPSRVKVGLGGGSDSDSDTSCDSRDSGFASKGARALKPASGEVHPLWSSVAAPAAARARRARRAAAPAVAEDHVTIDVRGADDPPEDEEDRAMREAASRVTKKPALELDDESADEAPQVGVAMGSVEDIADDRPYRFKYLAKVGYDIINEKMREERFDPSKDRLDWEQYADAVSVAAHRADFSCVVGIFGERGSGRTAFLDLVWQALERRQAEDHARERPHRVAACCNCSPVKVWACKLCCWRCCCFGHVDFTANTLHGYYIPCRINATHLMGNDRVWGTILTELWHACGDVYGPWHVDLFRRFRDKTFPRFGPILILLFSLEIFKILVIVGTAIGAVLLVLMLLRQGSVDVKVVYRFVQVHTTRLATIGAALWVLVAGFYVFFKPDPASKQLAADNAAEDEAWRNEQTGYHGKVIQELDLIAKMLETHVRLRHSWCRCLWLYLPRIFDGLLCDGFFTCYAWPEVVLLIDDIDKIPTPLVVRLFEALTLMSRLRGPKRERELLKIVIVADPWILDRALGHYYSGAASAYDGGTGRAVPGAPGLGGGGTYDNDPSELATMARVVAEGERFTSAFVNIPFVLPTLTLDSAKKGSIAHAFLRHMGMPRDENEGLKAIVPLRTDSKSQSFSVKTPDGLVHELQLEPDAVAGETMVRGTRPRGPPAGDELWRVEPPAVRAPLWRKLCCPRNLDPQHYAARRWRAGAEARLEFGVELPDGDSCVFRDAAAFLPANPRALWRVIAVFHVAQRLQRQREVGRTLARRRRDDPEEEADAAPPSRSVRWRAKLLRYVLASERWPYRTAWLRHTIVHRAEEEVLGPRKAAGNIDGDTLLADAPARVYPVHLDAELLQTAAAPLLALDEGANEYRAILLSPAPLTVRDLLLFDRVVRNISPALVRHIRSATELHAARKAHSRQAKDFAHAALFSPRNAGNGFGHLAVLPDGAGDEAKRAPAPRAATFSRSLSLSTSLHEQRFSLTESLG